MLSPLLQKKKQEQKQKQKSGIEKSGDGQEGCHCVASDSPLAISGLRSSQKLLLVLEPE